MDNAKFAPPARCAPLFYHRYSAKLGASFVDAGGALAMLPVILWQGWETLGEAWEEGEEKPSEKA